MQKIKGTYASAVIYSDTAEDYALAQVKMICDSEAAAGSKICLMPGCTPRKSRLDRTYHDNRRADFAKSSGSGHRLRRQLFQNQTN